MKIEPGVKAPQFRLFNTDKKEVSLQDYKDRNVLLLFFPQAFTSVCTKELCGMRDDISRYDKAHAQVLGISVDSVFTLARFREEQALNFPLLSDFNKETSRAYGALYDNWILNMHGVSKRSAFVIDKEGILRYAEVLENAGELPDFGKINATLESLP